jgi:uncharacterized membrane protein YqjE
MLESSVVKMHCETALYRCFYPVLVRSDGHATGHFLQWEAGRISMCTCLMDMQTYMHIYIYVYVYIYKVHMIIYIYIQFTCIDTMCAWIVCIYIICMYIYIYYIIYMTFCMWRNTFGHRSRLLWYTVWALKTDMEPLKKTEFPNKKYKQWFGR